MSYSRRPGRNSGSGMQRGSRSARGPRGSGIRNAPPPPPPRPVSVFEDDDDEDHHWGETGGDWDEAPRRAPNRRGSGHGGRGSRRGRGGRGRRGGRREQSTDGTGAFICAILGWVLCAPLGLVGLIMGLNAISSARARGMEPNGMASAAVWLGGMACVVWVVALVIIFGMH